VDTLVVDLDWQNTVDLPTAADTTDYLKNAILVDYPQNYWLVLYYADGRYDEHEGARDALPPESQEAEREAEGDGAADRGCAQRDP
jgi:hypothetical protein